jgi:hypothetical protein
MTFSENFSFCYTQMKENKVKLFLLSSLTLQHRLLPYKRKGYSILANRITRWSITNSILLSYFFNCAQKKIFNKRTFVSLLFLSRLFISRIIKRNGHQTTETIHLYSPINRGTIHILWIFWCARQPRISQFRFFRFFDFDLTIQMRVTGHENWVDFISLVIRFFFTDVLLIFYCNLYCKTCL